MKPHPYPVTPLELHERALEHFSESRRAFYSKNWAQERYSLRSAARLERRAASLLREGSAHRESLLASAASLERLERHVRSETHG
jgi:hypothetical protein